MANGGLHDALWWHTFVFTMLFSFVASSSLYSACSSVSGRPFWVAAWMDASKGVALVCCYPPFGGVCGASQ